MSLTRMQIGLSLSQCVKDIYKGKVPIENVAAIVAGTKASTPEEIDELIERYRKVSWNGERGMRDACEAIARQLFADGRVIQPRLRGVDPGPAVTAWVAL